MDHQSMNIFSLLKNKYKNLKEFLIAKNNDNPDDEYQFIEEEKDQKTTAIELSPISIFKSTLVVIAVLIGAYLLYSISNILILFLVAFFVTAALDPVVDYLQGKKIPRALGLLIIYLIFFFLVALLIAQILPLIASQLVGIAQLFNNFIQGFSADQIANMPFGNQINEVYKAIDFKVVAQELQNSLQLISSQLVSLGGNLWEIILQISNGFMNFILVLILVFFMTVDEMAIENFCISIFPTSYSPYISHRMGVIRRKIGLWIRGQFFVSLFAAVITFIGLAIAGVNYSLIISIITGVSMVIPVFGRVAAIIITLPIVFNQSPALALFMIIYFFLISQVENNIIVPMFMNKAVGLSPILIIFALLVGFQFLGILGLVLAIPIATILAIFVKDIGKKLHA